MDDATLAALQQIVADTKAKAAAAAARDSAALIEATWRELEAALGQLQARHAEEREALAADYKVRAPRHACVAPLRARAGRMQLAVSDAAARVLHVRRRSTSS